STLTRPTMSSAARMLGPVPGSRRISTGGIPEKQPILNSKRSGDRGLDVAQRAGSFSPEPLRNSLPEIRRTTVLSNIKKPTNKPEISVAQGSGPISPVSRTLRMPAGSNLNKQELVKKASVRSSPSSVSSVTRMSSPSMESSGSTSSIKKSVKKISPRSIRSPTISSQARSFSSRDACLIMLPQIEVKVSDDLRLDLRGHKIRSLKAGGTVNLSENLEFVYLRDNTLSSLEGVEVLKRVKVLDLSFNDFKGPGFEPLDNCKALQQLYLAGNQITSLKSLPELPNLEFLSVAQNKLKSLSMASQPRLQVLAASKNKISTLKGFPYLPVLEHLRVEENPILKMTNLEAASILLVGPTLKKFNDRDLSRDEIALAKCYPTHTSLCIRDGWDLCRPEQALDSTFNFFLDRWKEKLPSGYLLKKAFLDRPFEGDACSCHFEFVRDNLEDGSVELGLKYQWFIGDKTLSKFITIDGARGKTYIPKREDIGRILKVECTPVQGDTDYPSIFAISSSVSQGTGIPKVMKIDVYGDLVEGSAIEGHADVAWCGGTPAIGISSWLRRRRDGNPVAIAGAETEKYQLVLEDVDSCLVYMYTPATEEGGKGEPQYVTTDIVKAAPPSVSNVQIIGDAVEGNILRGIGDYFGGKEGPSTYEWLREKKDSSEFVTVLKGSREYALTKEDISRRLTFVYTPVNFEGNLYVVSGKEGEPVSVVSQVVKKAPPKVTHVKIIGDLKEGSKITVTGIVTGGTEASSRVQWFKTNSPVFEGENVAEALTTSKISKARYSSRLIIFFDAYRIPLGAVGKYIAVKFIPLTPDGEAGEPVYVTSEAAVEMLPPSLNFLSITGDYLEGEVLTASYGYIGGHEGMSIYNWYIHEVEDDSGTVIPEGSGRLQYRIPKGAIGKFISFACTPVRSDGISGEQRNFFGQERVRPGNPRLLSFQVKGTAVEGNTLNVEKKYWGGEEGETIYRWFRTGLDGTWEEISCASESSYTLALDDVGFFISISCEPIRNDGARGPIVVSEQIGPVIAGPPSCSSLEFNGLFVEGERLSIASSYSGG
ncbi:hypothetical protein M569_07968, partial [Genlisea aurea]